MAEASILPQRKFKLSCSCFPDFAAVCLFIEKFGDLLGLLPLNIESLKQGFEDESEDVSDFIKELHIYLLRRLKKNVPAERWERELVKFCFSYNQWHAWELSEQGYAKLKLSTRLSIIRNLLEAQFDANLKFQERLKSDIAEEDLRKLCYGRDKNGFCYWLIQDDQLTINVYRVEQDDTDGASWQIVAKDRDELATLIECLKEGRPVPCVTAQEATRSDTPVSMISSATGAGINPSRTATPTKFALDRSLTATPVKSSLAVETARHEAVSAEPSKSEVDSVTLEPAKQEPAMQGPVKQEPVVDSDTKATDDGKSEEDMAQQKEIIAEAEAACEPMETQTEGITTADSHPQSDKVDEVVESCNENVPTGTGPTGTGPTEMGPIEDCSVQSNPTDANRTDASNTDANGTANQQLQPTNNLTSSDSDDDIPLSQIKKSCILLSQARKSLMKAKKKHEKKKYKEMVKKQKGKSKKKLKLHEMADSPKASPMRSSGRQRKPVLSEYMTDENSDSSVSNEDEYIPKQGRNARRQAKRTGTFAVITQEVLSSEVDNDDTPCSSCGKYNQPHLILLCDKCDAGWHTGCVKPPLFYIPEGDWHCPTCEHTLLLEKLEAHLEKLDELIKSEEAKKKRQERQVKYALSNGINLSNIINDFEESPKPKRPPPERTSYRLDAYDYDSYEEDSYVPSKRSCRQRHKVNYKFEEYEALINSAIKNQNGEDPTILRGTNTTLISTAPPPPRKSKGKDLSNLLDQAGSKLSLSSEEEEEEDEEGEERSLATTTGKEERSLATTGKENKRGRKRTTKLNDIDADSAGEEDEDYDANEDGNEDDDNQSGETEESLSDDAWTPARGNRKSGGKRRSNRIRRSRRPLDDVAGFICDDEEESDNGRKLKRRGPPRGRAARAAKSASVSQAAVRAKRADFGFTSSEESLATTPCSSSTEEEDAAAKRVINKWNTMKTYSKPADSKGSKKNRKKKKRKRVKADYNSDASTEQETSSAEEYSPADSKEADSKEAASKEAASKKAASDASQSQDEPDMQESDQDNSEEEGVHRVNNRLESSSEEEEVDKDKDNKNNNSPDKLEETASSQSAIKNTHSDSKESHLASTQATVSPTATTAEAANGKMGEGDSIESSKPAEDGHTEAKILQAPALVSTTSAPSNPSKVDPIIASPQATTIQRPPTTATSSGVSETQSSSGYGNTVSNNNITSNEPSVPINCNNSNSNLYVRRISHHTPNVLHPTPTYPSSPRYPQQARPFAGPQPGYGSPYQYHGYPAQPASLPQQPSSTPPRPVRSINGQPPPGYFQQRAQYPPPGGMSWPAEHYMQPHSMPSNHPYSNPYNHAQHHVPTSCVNMQAPAMQQAPVVTEQTSSSNSFMVDSLLQSQSSHNKGTTFESSSAAVGNIAEEEEDEMSSYMAMASSLVTGGSDKT